MNRNTRSLRSLATRQSRRRNNQFALFTRNSPAINPFQPIAPDQDATDVETGEGLSDPSFFRFFAPAHDPQAEQADLDES